MSFTWALRFSPQSFWNKFCWWKKGFICQNRLDGKIRKIYAKKLRLSFVK